MHLNILIRERLRNAQRLGSAFKRTSDGINEVPGLQEKCSAKLIPAGNRFQDGVGAIDVAETDVPRESVSALGVGF